MGMDVAFDGDFITFFVLALGAIIGAVLLINLKNVVHMVFAASFTFLAIAGLFVTLDAEFLAFVQVLVYAGAVTILMIFGIMMTNQLDEDPPSKPWYNGTLFVAVAGIFGFLFLAIQSFSMVTGPAFVSEDNTRTIGEHIFSLHVIPFEMVSLLLTVALIGAIVLAKREEEA